MNLICPSCGRAGNETVFSQIGQKKLLCTNCKAVLQIALKCPACDGIISMPFMSVIPVNGILKFLYRKNHSDRCGKQLSCPACQYQADLDKFPRVAVFNEAYSILM